MIFVGNTFRTALAAVLVAVVLPAAASAATGSIHGTVVEAAGATALSQYTVELYSADRAKLDTECTDGAGQYGFTGLGTGTYYVQFSGDPVPCARTGYAPSWYNNRRLAKNADPITVTDGADRPGINAALQPEATISGTVTDAITMAAVERVSVRVLDSDGLEASRACTAADGTYTARRLNDIPYVVQFVADGSCGVVGPYPTRFYRFAEPNGSATAAGATSVSSNFGQDLKNIDVRLSFVVADPGGVPTPTPTATATATLTPTTTVTPSPSPTQTTTPSPTPAASGTPDEQAADGRAACTIARPSKVRARRFSVAIRCDQQAAVVVRAALQIKRSKPATTLRLPKATFTGAAKTVSFRVPRKAVRALKAKRRLTASISLVATTGAGSTKVASGGVRLT
jgi:hypothetical protein